MSKVLSFFNHKGGVGKTTSVHNIGYGLAKLGKKVLLIDADPQMNLTAAVYGLSTESYYGYDEISKWKEYNQKYTAFSKVLENIIQSKTNNTTQFYTYQDAQYNNIAFDLLRGDITLNSLDADVMSLVLTKNNLTKHAIHALPSKLFDIYKDYDFVLIDQSPSASSIINAIVSLTASYVIIPCTPTFFSLQAVNNLVDVWKHWRRLLEYYEATYNEQGLILESKFLGIIIQLGKRWKSGNAKHTEEWKKIVNEGISEFVKFQSSNSIDKDDFRKIFSGEESSPYIISTYDDFTPKLRSIAEDKGTAFVALKESDLPQSNANENNNQYLKSWQSMQKTNEYICQSLIKLL